MSLDTGEIVEGTFPCKPEDCLSTHGGAGYVLGSFIDEEGNVVCGLCGGLCNNCYPLPNWLRDGVETWSEYQRYQQATYKAGCLRRLVNSLIRRK